MATRATRFKILSQRALKGAAVQHWPWNSARRLSRGLVWLERFLASAGFDRMPWVVVAFGAGIAAWFALPGPSQWLALVAGGLGTASLAGAIMAADGRYPLLRMAVIVLSLALSAGCLSVWTRSELVGARPITRPFVAELTGKVLSVEPQPANARSRVIIATRDPSTAAAIRVRLNVPQDKAPPEALRAGDWVEVRARLVPPAPPLLPGAYNFARAAWFGGLSATGSALDAPRRVKRGDTGSWLNDTQRRLNAHVRERLAPEHAGIAAALVTGDMGGIAQSDTEAMRDSGLAHLLSISGLHVSAVVGAVYLLALRLFALWPWLALRTRLPVLAAASGALAGVAYTLLSGAQVPTVRSCIGSLLVLAALALGREALSLRMLAIAAFLVLLLWPEALIGPSFQMSFAAVLAIVALSGAGPIRAFLSVREEPWYVRLLRHGAMVLLTGVVIEMALMPIGLFHFHRAGFYGALANVAAIPLTTFVIMPAVLGALLLDIGGLGAPAWWIAGQAIALLTTIAHWVASRPGAVTVMPAFGSEPFLLFVAGGLWLGLWRSRLRWLGLIPAAFGAILLLLVRPADVLVSSDGRHVGITSDAGDALYLLRETKSSFARDNLTEIAGMAGAPVLLRDWPAARCNPEVCIIPVYRGGRRWTLMLTKGGGLLAERAVIAACERVDIVISDRWLPRGCQPKWLKADRRTLASTGGLAIDLSRLQIATVAEGEGRHGWWVAQHP